MTTMSGERTKKGAYVVMALVSSEMIVSLCISFEKFL
jgi:hypothetical protein